jgi:hypothetical protein
MNHRCDARTQTPCYPMARRSRPHAANRLAGGRGVKIPGGVTLPDRRLPVYTRSQVTPEGGNAV